ncbi:MAG: HPr family phosphocarrier protein [Planctomycetes bacterium]|nr:HPr family phosphocarrier protein [Planctomycetota bacterium]
MAVERIIRLENKLGLHVRPSAQLAELASKYKSDVIIIKESLQANAKSIMDLLTLAATGGTSLTIKVDGPDAEAAIDAIQKLINSKFGEE